MATKSLNLVLIYGSVRESRQGIKAVKFIFNQLKQRKHHVTVVDPLKYQLPLLHKTYRDYPKGKAPVALEKLARIFRKADAFVIVSGEYNNSVPPALSNLLDHFWEEYRWRPSAIVSYSTGQFGGVRAAMQLRVLLAELGMPSIPTTFPIPKVQEAFDGQGQALNKWHNAGIIIFLEELEWYAEAFCEQRKKSLPK